MRFNKEIENKINGHYENAKILTNDIFNLELSNCGGDSCIIKRNKNGNFGVEIAKFEQLHDLIKELCLMENAIEKETGLKF